MIKVIVKNGECTIHVPTGVPDGEYELTKKDDKTDIYKFYFAVPIAELLAYANRIGKTINGNVLTKENADAYLWNSLKGMFDKTDYALSPDAKFLPIITKRDLTTEQLIDYVNAACSLVGGKSGKVLPTYNKAGV